MVPFQRPMMYRCRSADGQLPYKQLRELFFSSLSLSSCDCTGEHPTPQFHSTGPICRRGDANVVMFTLLWDQAGISGSGQNGNHSRRAGLALRRLMGRLKPIQTEIHSPLLWLGR